MWQPPSAMTLPLKGKPGLRATRGRVSRIEKAPASNGAFPYAGTGRSHRENEEGDWQMRGCLMKNSPLRPRFPATTRVERNPGARLHQGFVSIKYPELRG